MTSDHIEAKRASKERRVAEARENSELLECNCCFDDEVLQEDMLPCADGHLSCRECVRRSAETNIGKRRVKQSLVCASVATIFYSLFHHKQ